MIASCTFFLLFFLLVLDSCIWSLSHAYALARVSVIVAGQKWFGAVWSMGETRGDCVSEASVLC